MSEGIMNELLAELELSGMDSYLEQTGIEFTFSELVRKVIGQGWGIESITDIVTWIRKLLFSEIQTNKILFLEVLLITVCFSFIKNTISNWGNGYISEVCFWLVYAVLALLLLKSMYIVQDIATNTLEQCTSFMRLFVPSFCMGLFFSANGSAATGFYQLAFVLIYLVEWAFLKILLPCVHIYVLLQIYNHFFEEEQFGNLAELLQSMILWGVKISMTAVLGLGVVQNLLNPVKDRLAQGTAGKIVSAIPGVGGVADSVGELVIGSAMVIKNGLGIAGIIVLGCMGAVPLLKTACMCLFYKVMAAVTEPLSDKRISKCIQKLSNGVMLYFKIQGYCMLLFFITIALTTSATSFVY